MPQAGIIREHSTGLSWFQRVLDVLCIVGVQFLVDKWLGGAWGQAQLLAMAATLASFEFVAEYNKLYQARSAERMTAQLTKLGIVWLVVIGLLPLVAFLTKASSQFSRIATFAWFVGIPLTLAANRLIVRAALKQLSGGDHRTIAIVGCTPLAQRLIDVMSNDATMNLELAGIYDDRFEPRQVTSNVASMVIGNIDQLIADIRQVKINRVYLTLPLRAEERISDILHRLADTTATVYYVPDLSTFTLLRAKVTSVGHIPAFSIFDSPFQGVDGSLKRVEDLVLAFTALLMAGIPMLCVALAIKLTTRGPVLFRQRRYGLGGKEIRVFKFRTMTVAEDTGKITQAKENDQRITVIGAVLRKTSIDELPQLFNVIGGSMSLVGPRPHAVAHNEQFRAIVGNYMLRHKVKPGITGWAQVNGLRGETDVTEKMRKRVEYDLYYINNWNLLFDMKIMWLTVFGRRVRKNAF